MGDAAMDLAMDDQWVDGAADIVDRRIADDLDDAGIGIDIDLADMAAIREAREIDGLVAFGGKRPAQLLRQVVAAQRRRCGLEYADRPVGALDAKTAVGEFEIGRSCLQHVAGDLRAFGDDVAGCVEHDDARKAQCAAGMRAAADCDTVGVAGDEPHAVNWNPQPLADQLCKAGLVPLAVGYGADDDLDDTVRKYRDLGAFARGPGY